MSLGKETAVVIEDWSHDTEDSHGFLGGIKYCRRSQGEVPRWTLFATDGGEIRVYDYLGVHHPEDDVSLGYNPDDVYINNEDTPLIAVKNGTTIRVYEEGSELFNTGAIANLQYINISNGFLHCTVSGGVGVQFRSLTDGSVTATVAVVMDGIYIGELWPTESGAIVFTQYRDTSGSRYGHTIKVNTAGIMWNRQSAFTNGYPQNLRCSGDGSLIVFRENSTGFSRARVVDGDNNLLDDYAPSVQFTLACNAQPDGAYCAWARRGTTTARIIKSDGTVVNVVLPANIVNREDATECVLGDYIIFACQNGNIYVYDSAGNIQATIAYGLALTPIAAVII